MNVVLPPKFVEKPWGCDQVDPAFSAPEGRIGEIWFEPPAELARLLVKFLFTSERLSVQVHPTDEQASARGLGRKGKDECWLVLASRPGAMLGIGLRRAIDAEELRSACTEGRIADELVWREVKPGDFFYIPANTIHAIGAGMVLLEVQQSSDITYRLYDYGRGRDLHLVEALAIANSGPYPDDLHRHLPDEGDVVLVEGPHFRLDRVSGTVPESVAKRYRGTPLLVVPLSGMIDVDGSVAGLGTCVAASDIAHVRLSRASRCVLAQPL